MSRQVGVRWVLAAVLTVVAYVVVVMITGFVACGVSGCSGGGFGPVFDPVGAQVGLLVAGLSLAPCAGFGLRGQRRVTAVLGTVAAVVVGSVLAMVLLGLGPDGCPQGFSRVRAGEDAFAPGTPTCRAA